MSRETAPSRATPAQASRIAAGLLRCWSCEFGGSIRVLDQRTYAVLQAIQFACLLALCSAVAGQGEGQLLAKTAHPSYVLCRYTDHQRKIGDIAVYDRTGANERIPSNRHTAHYGAVGAQ